VANGRGFYISLAVFCAGAVLAWSAVSWSQKYAIASGVTENSTPSATTIPAASQPQVSITEINPATASTPVASKEPAETSQTAPSKTNQVLGAVRGLHVVYSGPNTETLAWDAVPGAVGYNVYIATKDGYGFKGATPMQTTSRPYVTLRGFPQDTLVAYYVIPFDAAGHENKDPVNGLHLWTAMSPAHERHYENDIVFITMAGGHWATGWMDNGEIVTCDHVVEGLAPYYFQFVYESGGRYHLGRKHQAAVVATDHARDEATLVPVNPNLTSRLQWKLVAAATPPKIGEKVFTVGFPNRRLTLTTGVYLGTGVTVNVRDYGMVKNPPYYKMRIYPGASGSPIFDLAGQVVGMVEGYLLDQPGTCIGVASKSFPKVGVSLMRSNGLGTEFKRGKGMWIEVYGG
jgi:hypothetical protein